jgi:hypothetical protein
MVNSVLRSFLLLSLLILGACASKMGKQMDSYRTTYAAGDFDKAKKILEKSELKKEKNSHLLWSLEKGTTALALNDLDTAISSFNSALDEIDKLYTQKISLKAASFLINDASDVFYGANYERSYAHYFLSKSYYARYLKTGTRLDLQSARATILAWDTYFTEVQRAGKKTLYHTDLMMKVFGGEIHEVSDIRSDKQISLQLYKDALLILDREGGLFSLFNKKNVEYVKAYEEAMEKQKAPKANTYERTAAYEDLKHFLQYKVLALTKEIRTSDFNKEAKAMNASADIIKKAQNQKANVVLVLEEGLIPPKIGKPFNFGLRGAVDAVDNPNAKAAIAAVGTVFLTQFAMDKLNMWPTQTASPGSFIFAYEVTKLAVQEAAIEFELPMIENVPLVQRLELFVLDEAGKVVTHEPLPIVSENGDIARVVLEEDVVSRYVKTGTRVAVKHIIAIVAAIAVYKQVERKGGEFFAKAAAMATYIGASKGIKAMERADTRHWTTLPQALRLSELTLKPGNYQVAVSAYAGAAVPQEPMKVVGNIVVPNSGKTIHTIKFSLNP